jgi:hypothetical protein
VLEGIAFLAGVVALVGGCLAVMRLPFDQNNDEGVVAFWVVDEDQTLGPKSTRFTALVTRGECSSGMTGEVREPELEFNASEIVVTFTVAPNPPGDYSCQGNDWVPYVVEFGQQLGIRRLVDGQCFHGDAATTADCIHTTRWPPRTK